MLRKKKYIVERYEGNPILTAEDFPGDILWVFNSAVVKKNDGKYVMVCRCEDSGLARYLWVCDSADGISFKPRPAPLPMPHGNPIFDKHCRGRNPSTMNSAATLTYLDPRITCIEGQHYIIHAAHTDFECQLGLFKIDDGFEKLEWIDLISLPDNRNGVLFPEKIRGKYFRLERPNSGAGNKHIWMQSSPDLIHWGMPRLIASTSDTGWAYTSVGPGAPPIRTSEGWLCIIHGIRKQAGDSVYGLGAMLLDLEDPSKVIGISKRCILAAQKQYELDGQTPSVVFTNAAILENDGTVKIYYGAADAVQCLAFAKLADLLHACKHE